MDIHDVSNVSKFGKVLLIRKEKLRDAYSRRGEEFVHNGPVDEIIQRFMYRMMMKQGYIYIQGVENEPMANPSFLPPPYSPCLKSFSDLRKINIENLCIETHHRDTYLLVRPVTPADRMSGTLVMAIVEDENNHVIMLQLFHQELEGEEITEQIFNQYRAFIIKEPYMNLLADGDYGLRVDHSSDVICLPDHDQRIPRLWWRTPDENTMPASAWNAKGYEYFKESKYRNALECYTQALGCSPTLEEVEAIRLNKCLAFLKERKFESVLSEFEFFPAKFEKALACKANALYQLRRYRECCEVLKSLLLEYPQNSAARPQLSRAINRCLEQEYAKYQFRQLYEEIRELRPPLLDHATYVGPVAVRQSGSRGRGLFTTKAVNAGDLLLCEKAFAYAYLDNEELDNPDVAVLFNLDNDKITIGSQPRLITEIVQKIHRNPSLASVITELHHEPCESVGNPEADSSIVDSFLVERIVSLNSFGCSLSSLDRHLKAITDDDFEDPTETSYHSCGIWPMAFYINHECYSNARRSFIGDMMIIRASQDIPADTEIHFWYQMPSTVDYVDRQKRLRHWGFECGCVICEDDKATNNITFLNRKKLRDGLKKAFQSEQELDTSVVEAMLVQLEGTYNRPASEVPRLGVWDAYFALAQHYFEKSEAARAVDSILKVFASLGYIIEGGSLPHTTAQPIAIKKWGIMVNSLIRCWIILCRIYHEAAPDLEMHAVEYTRITYKICIGEDESFEDAHVRSNPE